MNHTPYIIAAYAVFFAVLAWDLLAPAMARRKLLQRLQARLARDAARGAR